MTTQPTTHTCGPVCETCQRDDCCPVCQTGCHRPMQNPTIRLSPDTYRRLLDEKARLEIATGRPQSFNDTIIFLLLMAAERPAGGTRK